MFVVAPVEIYVVRYSYEELKFHPKGQFFIHQSHVGEYCYAFVG